MTIRFIASQLPVIDLANPTDPNNYVDRSYAQGMPIHWRNDQTGTLPAAVRAFYNQDATPEQLKLVIAYIQHHIHAPCFLEKSPFLSADPDPDITFEPEIKALRKLSLTLVTAADISAYISRAMDIALDPL